MSDELDISKLTLEDVNLSPAAAVTETTPVADPVITDPVTNPVTDPVDPVVEPAKPADPTPEPAKAEPAKYDFKDDFIKNVVDYYEKTGDITPYLQAKLTDFNGMSDEELMRRELREQYPDVSDKAFDKLYKQQVVDKYKLDSETWEEDDVELGKELLKSEASKIRAKLLEWQAGFKAPDPTPDNSQEEIQSKLQEFQKKVTENEVTKSILNDKRIAIKTADGDFNFEIPNPNELLDMTIDNSKFFGQFTPNGTDVDYAKWYKTAAYSKDPETFERSLINFGKTLGREEITKEIKNPSTEKIGDIPTEHSGDFASGLLSAFANKGVHK